MKANAPEKIYAHVKNGKAFNTWNSEWIGVNDIEYVRKDAFIEKACEWLRNNSHNYANNTLGKEYLVSDFKNYMEGE